jgi:hypothetical protein
VIGICCETGDIVAVFESKKDAACFLKVSPTNMSNIINHGRVVDGKIYQTTNQEDLVAQKFHFRTKDPKAARKAASQRASARKELAQEVDPTVLAMKRKKVVQKKVNFQSRSNFSNHMRTFARKTSGLFDDRTDDLTLEGAKKNICCYLVVANGINPNQAGTTNDDADLFRAKPQILFTPLTDSGSVEHIRTVLETVGKKVGKHYNGGWMKDTDQLAANLNMTDEDYEEYYAAIAEKKKKKQGDK